MKRMLSVRCTLVAVALAGCPIAARAQAYPKTLAATAEVSSAAGKSSAAMTIRVERLMDDLYFKRVADALKFGGYLKFLPALRTLPAIGYVQLGETRTDLKYARERPDGKPRLVLGTDRPVFFVGAGAPDAKPRTGYDMAVIELDIDAQGNGQGTMAAAARVRPAPDGSVIVDDYADTPVKISIKPAK